MKKYFVEIIPVEGEIKDGVDVIFNIGSDVVHRNIKVDSTSVYDSNGKLLFDKECTIRVKLVLCSRDIKKGDEIYSDFDKSPLGKSGVDAQGFNFKIIGEISPEATWVKKGMEFDRNEIQPHYLFGGSTWRQWPDDTDESYWLEDNRPCMVKIKCTNCKTFH
jgi:hypothetical protein